jgi:hypothetical protein
MSVDIGPEATAAVRPWECEFGTADLIDDALAVLHESGVGVGPFLRGLRAARQVAEAAIATELAMLSRPRQVEGPFISPRQGRSGGGTTDQRRSPQPARPGSLATVGVSLLVQPYRPEHCPHFGLGLAQSGPRSQACI